MRQLGGLSGDACVRATARVGTNSTDRTFTDGLRVARTSALGGVLAAQSFELAESEEAPRELEPARRR